MSRKRTPIPQAAAIAVKGSRVCIVTTDGNQGEWVIPKGNLKGSFRDTVSMEAWEEAGVRGKVSRRALTTFTYHKAGKTYRVKVYRLRVSRVSSQWPERKSRRREWLTPEKAVARLKYRGMRSAVRKTLVRRAA